MIQQGATTLGQDKGYINVVWTHVDLGSNTHICNSVDPVQNMQSADGGLGQVSGSKVPIHGIGVWPVVLGQQLISLPEKLVMPGNPTSTLGGSALKGKSGYSRVTYDINLFFRIEVNKHTFTYATSNGTMRTFNALDYMPLLMWIDELPSTARTRARQSNAAILPTTIRKSTSQRFPSQKVRDNIDIALELKSASPGLIEDNATSSPSTVALAESPSTPSTKEKRPCSVYNFYPDFPNSTVQATFVDDAFEICL